MKNVHVLRAMVLGLALAVPAVAAEPVKVSEEVVSHGMLVAPYAGPDTMYPPRPPKGVTENPAIARIDAKVPVITLSNGLLEVKVVPTLGMRVLNAVGLTSGVSLAGTQEPREWENRDFRDIIGWDAGYVETSFPYFEHGMGVRQSAGYRVVKNADGSVTVAMNCRFTGHQEPRHMARYGRYADEILSHWVTLKPGEASYTLTVRKDNPNPLRRSNRLWTNTILQAEKYDADHILYPAGYVVPHGGGSVQPFWAGGKTPSFRGVSWFALHPDYGFGGAYRPATDTNALVISGPKAAPGLKLYTNNADGGVMEIWCGTTPFFESPGAFVGPYEPVSYTLTYRAAKGIGRVVYANPQVVLAQKEDSYYALPARAGRLEMVVDPADSSKPRQQVAAGDAGPDKPVGCNYGPGRYIIKLDGKLVADFTLPLAHTDTRDKLPPLKDLGGKLRLELEQITNHVGAPTARDAVATAGKLLKAGKLEDREQALSLANTCYRYGHFDLALRLVEPFPEDGEANYLRGLIAWENGQPVDFRNAGPDSYYLRALLAIQKGDTKTAHSLLEVINAQRPGAYRPRLLRAYLDKNIELAGACARENPASPEAQLVLELLGDKDAKAAKEALLKDNPEAPEQLAQFRDEITKGQWSPPRRYAPMLPKGSATGPVSPKNEK